MDLVKLNECKVYPTSNVMMGNFSSNITLKILSFGTLVRMI